MALSTGKIRPEIIQNLSAVSLHRVVQVVGIVTTVALVPRLFGAEDYGRFAFVLSLSYLGQILGDFGTLDVMGRFVPGMDRGESSRLYMRHLIFKVGVGAVCGLITAGVALALAGWMQPAWALLGGLGVWLHIVAWVPFQFSLGLNRIGTWMSEQAWRQWALLILLLILLPLFGFGGALATVVLMELLFCGLGLWWTRDYWQQAELHFDWAYLRPYVRFGFGFFLANLTAVALYRSGPLLVETLTGESTQTGYFNLALGLFLLAYITLSQFAQSLIPTLSDFYNRGETGKMRQWLQTFVRYGWLIGWLGVWLVWLVADWAVPLVFGTDFEPAAAALKWISLCIPATILLWAANVTATVIGRGRLKFGVSLMALIIFVVLALWLIPAYGAIGAVLALGLSTVTNGIFLSVSISPYLKLDVGFLSLTGIIGVVGIVGVVWLGG